MRILLDESLPKELRSELPGHDVRTVQEMGWSSVKNGDLLARSVAQFDVFVTADQNLSTLPVAVVVLVAKSNRMQELQPLIPELLASVSVLKPRTLVRIGG
jgi:hypothetical protein